MTGKHPALGGLADRRQLAADLGSLGLRARQDLLIHCSLRQVGPIDGGAATLLGAIEDVTGPKATLVVPAQTAGNSFSSRTFRAATACLEPDDYARFIAAMPGFDPVSTPSTGMGAFAEHVRTRPGARRSSHPQSSFAALGPRAAAAMAVHDLGCHLGGQSRLVAVRRQRGDLLGVGYAAAPHFTWPNTACLVRCRRETTAASRLTAGHGRHTSSTTSISSTATLN